MTTHPGTTLLTKNGPLSIEYERQHAALWDEFERQRAVLLAEYKRQCASLSSAPAKPPADR